MPLFSFHIDSSDATTPMSPTKDGKMREDKHWIIKIPRSAGFEHPYTPHCAVHPVTSDQVTFDVWKKAHGLKDILAKVGVMPDHWVGRRVNDEVELFLEEGEGEYDLLKQSLEESGLTVRPYLQPTESKKFPKASKETLEGGGKNTLMSRITKTMEHLVNDKEFEKSVKIQYGFLADVPGPKKALCIARVDEEMFEGLKGQKGAWIPSLYTPLDGKKEQWKIVGQIRDSEAKFWCGEETTKSYFDSLGQIGNTAWQDFVQEKEEKEREEKRKEKRAAKKHRRMITESTTATTPSEMSFGFRLTEEEEEVARARKRAKQNEKRKKQKQRRREEALEVIDVELKTGSDSDDTKSDDSAKEIRDLLQAYQKSQSELQAGTTTKRPGDSGVGSDEDSAEEERRPKVKLPKRQHQESSKGTEAGDEDQGVEIVVVQNMEEARQYMHRPMMLGWPEEDGSDRRAMFTDLSYVGRGL